MTDDTFPPKTGGFASRLTYYGWLDDGGDVVRWSVNRPPPGQAFIKRPPVRIAAPTEETHGRALI